MLLVHSNRYQVQFYKSIHKSNVINNVFFVLRSIWIIECLLQDRPVFHHVWLILFEHSFTGASFYFCVWSYLLKKLIVQVHYSSFIIKSIYEWIFLTRELFAVDVFPLRYWVFSFTVIKRNRRWMTYPGWFVIIKYKSL